jgi:hypothetical protein
MVSPPCAIMHDTRLQNLNYQYTSYRRVQHARNIQKDAQFLTMEGDIL